MLRGCNDVGTESCLVRLRPRANTIYIAQNRTVFAADLDGFIREGSENGFFVNETRLASSYCYRIDNKPPRPVALSNVEQHSWLGYYIALPPGAKEERDPGSGQMETVTEQTLELRLSRYIGEGMHEDIDIANFTQKKTSFTLTLQFDGDFADLGEIKGPRQQTGKIEKAWDADRYELSIDYTVQHSFKHQEEAGARLLQRSVKLRIEKPTSIPKYENSQICFAIELSPRGTWHACVSLIPVIDGKLLEPLYSCRSFMGIHTEYDRRRNVFFDEAMNFSVPGRNTLANVVVDTLEQAKHDLASLRLYGSDQSERAWIMSAGLPIYVALFGRDSLTTAWQAALLSTGMLKGTLLELANWQGRDINDWRDEQPGRMLHEAHDGPLEVLNFNPRSRYYGSVTTSAFFPVAVAELWHWTGDKELIRPLLDPALKALSWLDEYGDFDRDGFYEYLTHSEQGVRNQAWKDSPDAIVDEDGSQVNPPVATCEEQGFAYLAKLHMSEVLWWFDQKGEAKRLYREASELKKRVNEAFWMEDTGFFALGLDSKKRQIRSITSNPGHCLAAGIVDEKLVPLVAARLFEPDLFSGWGIRTLSSAHPAFNPYSYHRGSIWPVEQGTFAVGLKRYGYHNEVNRIAKAIFESASLFEFHRLPELFGGHQKDDDHPFPGLYPQACSPQAWSASAVFCVLQAMLGIYPYAPLNLLLVDPYLPEWLPEVTLSNLHVADSAVTIRFYRTESGGSDYKVLEKQGSVNVFRQPSPWSLTATYAERLKDAFLSVLPGK